MTSQSNNEVPLIATDAVLVSSQDMESGSEKVAGYDFNSGIDHHQLLKSFKYSDSKQRILVWPWRKFGK